MFKEKLVKALNTVCNFLTKHHYKIVLFIMCMGFYYHIRSLLGYVVDPWDLMVGYFYISVELWVHMFDKMYKAALEK